MPNLPNFEHQRELTDSYRVCSSLLPLTRSTDSALALEFLNVDTQQLLTLSSSHRSAIRSSTCNSCIFGFPCSLVLLISSLLFARTVKPRQRAAPHLLNTAPSSRTRTQVVRNTYLQNRHHNTTVTWPVSDWPIIQYATLESMETGQKTVMNQRQMRSLVGTVQRWISRVYSRWDGLTLASLEMILQDGVDRVEQVGRARPLLRIQCHA